MGMCASARTLLASIAACQLASVLAQELDVESVLPLAGKRVTFSVTSNDIPSGWFPMALDDQAVGEVWFFADHSSLIRTVNFGNVEVFHLDKEGVLMEYCFEVVASGDQLLGLGANIGTASGTIQDLVPVLSFTSMFRDSKKPNLSINRASDGKLRNISYSITPAHGGEVIASLDFQDGGLLIYEAIAIPPGVPENVYVVNSRIKAELNGCPDSLGIPCRFTITAHENSTGRRQLGEMVIEASAVTHSLSSTRALSQVKTSSMRCLSTGEQYDFATGKVINRNKVMEEYLSGRSPQGRSGLLTRRNLFIAGAILVSVGLFSRFFKKKRN